MKTPVWEEELEFVLLWIEDQLLFGETAAEAENIMGLPAIVKQIMVFGRKGVEIAEWLGDWREGNGDGHGRNSDIADSWNLAIKNDITFFRLHG